MLTEESLKNELEQKRDLARIMYIVIGAVLSEKGFRQLKRFLGEEQKDVEVI